jgi:hypothetical protein
LCAHAADIDCDGRNEVLLGTFSGSLLVYANTDTSATPSTHDNHNNVTNDQPEETKTSTSVSATANGYNEMVLMSCLSDVESSKSYRLVHEVACTEPIYVCYLLLLVHHREPSLNNEISRAGHYFTAFVSRRFS